MADPRKQSLSARRNTPFHETFTVTDAAGAALDLTGHSATMEVRLYGMQPGEPLIRLEPVTVALTQGVLVGTGEVTAHIEELELLFLPEGGDGLDVTFAYDLILTDADGFTWVERWGDFVLTDGVTGADIIFLAAGTGAVLTTADGDYLEVA